MAAVHKIHCDKVIYVLKTNCKVKAHPIHNLLEILLWVNPVDVLRTLYKNSISRNGKLNISYTVKPVYTEPF